MTDDPISERDGPTLEEMEGDWCYQVTVRMKDGHIAHPNIQAPDEVECQHRISVLYPRSTILEIAVLHPSAQSFHHVSAPRIFRRKDDLRPVERRVVNRRAQPNGGHAA